MRGEGGEGRGARFGSCLVGRDCEGGEKVLLEDLEVVKGKSDERMDG